MIIPSPDFWPGPINLNINGVISASPPLFISGATISVKNSASATVTEVSTDNTFTGELDTRLASQKAIKDYIASVGGGLILSVSLPLYISGTDLRIYDASALATGVVNTIAQIFAGDKTFSGVTRVSNATIGTSSITGALAATGSFGAAELWSGTGITLDGLGAPTYTYLRSTPTAIPMRLYANSGTYAAASSALVEVNNIATGGGLNMYSATGGTTRIGSPVSSNYITVAPTVTSVIGTGSPQFLVVNNGGNQAEFSVSSTGDLTINATGNDLNLHSSDLVHVLNNTNSSSKSTGALTVNGGVGINSDLWASQIFADDIIGPQLTLRYGAGDIATFDVNMTGEMDIVTTGNMVRTTSVIKTTNTTAATSSSTGALITAGSVAASDAWIGKGVTLDGVGAASYTYVRSTDPTLPLLLFNSTTSSVINTAFLRLENTGLGGNADLYAGVGGSVYIGSGTSAYMRLTPTALTLTSNTLPQFVIDYSGGNTLSFSAEATGKATVTTSGGTLTISNGTLTTSKTSGALVVTGGIGTSDGIWCNNATIESTVQPQLRIFHTSPNYLTYSVDATGNGAVNAVGGQYYIGSSTRLNSVNTTDSSSTTTGAIITAGGIGAAKNIYGKKLAGRNALDVPELDLADTGATGTCTMGIVTGGNTNILTSGSLLWNGALVTAGLTITSASQSVVWGGALPSVSSTVYYYRIGNSVTARIGQAVGLTTSSTFIISDVEVPVGYRPPGDMYQVMFVRIGIVAGVGQFGLLTIYENMADYKLKIYADAAHGSFPNATTCGMDEVNFNWLAA